MNHGLCVHCSNTVYESDERVSLSIGVAHFECRESFEKECRAEEKEFLDSDRKEGERQTKLLSRLKRTLKPKIWDAIERVMQGNFCHLMEIVSLDMVTGDKQRAHEWFGESVGIRCVYDDTTFCSYSDSYGGLVWLPIGKWRYLQMHISG